MSLTGDFRETQFADLIQFYGISKQSVAVRVSLDGAADDDGIFYFERGDLVAARLGGAAGRDAVRRALRLREGRFRVEVGAPPPPDAAPRPEPWQQLVLEELVRLDEEARAANRTPPAMPLARPAAARAAGARPANGTPANGASANGTNGATANGATPRPAPRAAPAAAPAPAATPARAASAPVPTPPPARAAAPTGPGAAPARPPARPPPSGGGAPSRPPAPPAGGRTALRLGAAAVVVIALGAVVWLVSRDGSAPPAVARAAAPPAAATRGVTATEIVFGMAAPFSGANKEAGRALRQGIEAAFAAVNGAGGVNGRTLRLVAQDDGYEPARTGPVMHQLVEQDRVFAMVGSYGSATAAVAIPYCLEQKTVFFGAFSGAALLRKQPPDRYVFNYRPSYAEETAAAVRYLVDVRRIDPTRIAVFAQEDDFGESGWAGASRRLEEAGVERGKILRLGYKRNTADVAEAVARLKEHAEAIDAVVMVATYKAAGAFIRHVRDAGLSPVFTNPSVVNSDALAEELVRSSPRYAEGVVVTQIVPLPTSRASAVLRYQKDLEKTAAGERPGFLTLEGWVVANLLVDALRRAGPELDSERLVAALEATRDLDLGIGTRLGFGPREHQASHKVWGTQLQPDGTYRPIELE